MRCTPLATVSGWWTGDLFRTGVGGPVDGAEERQDSPGPFGTSIARRGGGVLLPRLDEGDLLAIQAGGAYGPTASPLHFISHPLPAEVLVTGGQLRDVTRIRG